MHDEVPRAVLPDDLVPPEPASGGPGLGAALSSVLTTACRNSRLTTLELNVSDSPSLNTIVRQLAGVGPGELIVWATRVPADSMHDGFLLIASAPAAEPSRRQAVGDVAVLIEQLIVADRRCVQAELLAARAVARAEVDPLTQVGNRWAWLRALEQESLRAARYSHPATVIVVDLDGLKQINDTLGHAEGDAQLLRAAAALQAASRTVDTVCRLGGDEFGVLAPHTEVEGARELADRLQAALDRAGIAASVGAVIADGGDLEAAWREADAEMYRRKGPGQARRGRRCPAPAGRRSSGQSGRSPRDPFALSPPPTSRLRRKR